ncbi:hypothetical protein Tco_1159296, partial [Tanacetum coccineum]
MGTCSSFLFMNKDALMLSVEAVRYIIRISPCIGAVSVGSISTNFFISLSAASASCVHCMFFLSVQLLSTLKNGSDLSVPFDRKWLRAAIFPLRLCTSLSVFGCSTSVMAFTFEGLARIPFLVMRCPKNGPSSTPKEHFFGFSCTLDHHVIDICLMVSPYLMVEDL